MMYVPNLHPPELPHGGWRISALRLKASATLLHEHAVRASADAAPLFFGWLCVAHARPASPRPQPAGGEVNSGVAARANGREGAT